MHSSLCESAILWFEPELAKASWIEVWKWSPRKKLPSSIWFAVFLFDKNLLIFSLFYQTGSLSVLPLFDENGSSLDENAAIAEVGGISPVSCWKTVNGASRHFLRESRYLWQECAGVTSPLLCRFLFSFMKALLEYVHSLYYAVVAWASTSHLLPEWKLNKIEPTLLCAERTRVHGIRCRVP